MAEVRATPASQEEKVPPVEVVNVDSSGQEDDEPSGQSGSEQDVDPLNIDSDTKPNAKVKDKTGDDKKKLMITGLKGCDLFQ